MPGRFGVDQEQRHAACFAARAAGARGDEQMRGPRGGIDHALMAAQHIACAVLLRGGADICKVVAALRFGISKGDDDIAADDFGNDRIGHRAANRLQRAAADDDGLQIRLDRDDLAQALP